MNMYFSGTKKAFFTGLLRKEYEKSGAWPEDCVEINKEVYIEFKGVPPEGFSLGCDKSGYPTWVPKEITPQDKIDVCEALLKRAITNLPVFKAPLDLGISTQEEEKDLRDVLEYISNLNRTMVKLSKGIDTDIPKAPEEINFFI